jgi:hypothetical protein
MKPRLFLTAAALAALSMLNLAGVADATPPVGDDGPTVRHQPAIQDDRVCDSGHGPQFDCDQPSTPASPATTAPATESVWRQLTTVLSITAVPGVLAALAAGLIWSRLRHRPREAI